MLRTDLLDANVPEEAIRGSYGEELIALGKENPDVVVLSADLAGSTKTKPFGDKVDAGRFFNMGISEQDMVGTAAGLALTGKIVFVSSFAIFIAGRAWEQVRQSLGHAEVPVNLVSTHGGVSVGPDGGSHQMIEDLAVMRAIPKMRVIIPADARETCSVIRFVAQSDHPYYVRLSRVKFPHLYTDDYNFEMGKGTVLHRSDNDNATIIACGLMVKRALLAAKLLQDEGINIRVVNMASIKPIDTDLIAECARETGLITTFEEHNIIGGLGSAVAEAVCESHPCPVERFGIPDVFGQSGDAEDLLRHFGLVPETMAKNVKESIAKHRHETTRA